MWQLVAAAQCWLATSGARQPRPERFHPPRRSTHLHGLSVWRLRQWPSLPLPLLPSCGLGQSRCQRCAAPRAPSQQTNLGEDVRRPSAAGRASQVASQISWQSLPLSCAASRKGPTCRTRRWTRSDRPSMLSRSTMSAKPRQKDSTLAGFWHSSWTRDGDVAETPSPPRQLC